jgi:putative glutamine amidotransferase
MSPETPNRPRVGIPWRTSEEQQRGERRKLDYYFKAVESAGAEAHEISLDQSLAQLGKQLDGLDAFVLPGSPADVDPARYGSSKHEKTNKIDPDRDRTDTKILEHALSKHKPVLAICYGCQILNVQRNGSLIQDIPTERAGRPNPKPHGSTDLEAGAKKGDQEHGAVFLPGSRLAKLLGGTEAQINSSHHQAIDRAGEGLTVTAHSTDGVIEGVEWTGDANWVTGVQWHPERMFGDAFSERLFRDFVAAARGAVVQKS